MRRFNNLYHCFVRYKREAMMSTLQCALRTEQGNVCWMSGPQNAIHPSGNGVTMENDGSGQVHSCWSSVPHSGSTCISTDLWLTLNISFIMNVPSTSYHFWHWSGGRAYGSVGVLLGFVECFWFPALSSVDTPCHRWACCGAQARSSSLFLCQKWYGSRHTHLFPAV